MSYQWNGEYKFESGDIVEITNPNHPFNKVRGVVQAVMSTEQFRLMTMYGEMDCWADDLKLISTHRKSDIPKAFLE